MNNLSDTITPEVSPDIKEKPKTFYLIVRDRGERERLSGKKRHPTLDAAITEARRLRDEVGGKYIVMQAVKLISGNKKVKVNDEPQAQS